MTHTGATSPVPGPAVDLPDNPALRRALGAGDPAAASAALRAGTVLVPTLLVDGVPTPAVMTDPAGVRTLLAFTGTGPMQLWAPPGRAQRAGAVRGADVADLAAEQQVAAVVFDAAGPTPVATTREQVQHLAAGPSGPVALSGALEVQAGRGALAERLRTALPGWAATTEVWLFERSTAGGGALTVGLWATDPTLVEVALVTARSRLGALVPAGAAVDLMGLDTATRGHLLTHLPTARIPPAPE